MRWGRPVCQLAKRRTIWFPSSSGGTGPRWKEARSRRHPARLRMSIIHRNVLQYRAWASAQASAGLDQHVAVQARPTARRLGFRYVRKDRFIDPHCDVASVNQAGVVGRPVFDTVARLRLARLTIFPTHLLETINRESTQEPEPLTGAPDRLLCVNVSRPHAFQIYATTPNNANAGRGWLFYEDISNARKNIE